MHLTWCEISLKTVTKEAACSLWQGQMLATNSRGKCGSMPNGKLGARLTHMGQNMPFTLATSRTRYSTRLKDAVAAAADFPACPVLGCCLSSSSTVCHSGPQCPFTSHQHPVACSVSCPHWIVSCHPLVRCWCKSLGIYSNLLLLLLLLSTCRPAASQNKGSNSDFTKSNSFAIDTNTWGLTTHAARRQHIYTDILNSIWSWETGIKRMQATAPYPSTVQEVLSTGCRYQFLCPIFFDIFSYTHKI